MSKIPTVSVIMSVHNGQKYLRKSIQSILDQTFRDFEFFIIDDKSTDLSSEIIQSFEDERIVSITNEENLRLAASLNKGLNLATGKYVARMDDDDIALPERLEKQVDFLEMYPDIGLLGTYAEIFGSKKGVRQHSSANNELKVRTFFSCQFCHPSVMLRRSVLVQNNLSYNTSFKTAQDFELWSRLLQYTDFGTLPEILLRYRSHENQISNSCRFNQVENTKKIYLGMLNRLNVCDSFIDLHISLADFDFKREEKKIVKIAAYFSLLIKQNEKNKVFPEKSFSNFLSEYFYNIVKTSVSGRLKRVLSFNSSGLKGYLPIKFPSLRLFFN
tara:strand:+ start:5099 stop:6085 length:987 start_codon:yes stop_codon:yes gene_type:complete